MTKLKGPFSQRDQKRAILHAHARGMEDAYRRLRDAKLMDVERVLQNLVRDSREQRNSADSTLLYNLVDTATFAEIVERYVSVRKAPKALS